MIEREDTVAIVMGRSVARGISLNLMYGNHEKAEIRGDPTVSDKGEHEL